MLINCIFVSHFVDPDLPCDMSSKQGNRKKGGEGEVVEVKHWDTFVHLHSGLKKISCRGCLLFYCFFCDKKEKLLKGLFYFIPWLFNSFDFSSYGSESRKRCTLRLFRSNCPEVFLVKGVLKICIKFTGEHPSWGVISIKLHIFRTTFTKNTSEWLILALLMCLEEGKLLKLVCLGERGKWLSWRR